MICSLSLVILDAKLQDFEHTHGMGAIHRNMFVLIHLEQHASAALLNFTNMEVTIRK